jgi:hypothetical protein
MGLESWSGGVLEYQWNYFWKITGASFPTPAGGSEAVTGAIFQAYMGGAFAFLISMLGALLNIGKVIYYVESSIDDWIGNWKDGEYQEIIDEKGDRFDAMQFFLTGYTGDLILWSLAAIWHTGFIIASGYIAAFWIYWTNFCCKNGDTAAVERAYLASVKPRYGWKAMLFGVLVGSINFLSGSIMKSVAQSVISMFGFLNHEESGDDNTVITTTATINGVTTNTVVNTAGTDDNPTSFNALLDLQENWFTFYIMIRVAQLTAPYLFLATVEGTMAATFALFFIYGW